MSPRKTTAPALPRLQALEIGLTLHPIDQRARDDEALESLCKALDEGQAPGRHWKGAGGVGEPWSVILRRRIASQYPKTPRGHAQWLVRHFHVRQHVNDRETPEQSAEHVARVWAAAGLPLNARTILGAAGRAAAKKAAIDWMRAVEARSRLRLRPNDPVPAPLLIYAAMDRAIATGIAPEFAAELARARKGKAATAK